MHCRTFVNFFLYIFQFLLIFFLLHYIINKNNWRSKYNEFNWIKNKTKKRRIRIIPRLAKKIGYKSRSSINKIELDQNNLTQTKIKIIADALNTTPGYIMGWENQNSNNVLIELNKLTDSEKRLLTDFRTLSKQGQEYILQTMNMVKEKYKKISLSELENDKDA